MPLRHLGLLLVAGLTGLVGCSDLGNPIRPKAEPILSASALDFGTVAVSGSAVRSVTVSNFGSAPLTGTATISCAGYQLVSGGGAFSIAPGESRSITIRFSPGAVGSFPCALDLGPNTPQVALTGSGAVQTPGAASFVAPDSIDFGVAPVGTIKTGAFQVFSVGTAPLLVNVVSTSADYAIVSGGGVTEIPPGGFINVLVEFRPQAGLDRSGTIVVGPGSPDVVTKGFGTTVSYKSDIRPILDTTCNQACHIHVFHDPDSYPNFVGFGNWVSPFNLNSTLYFYLTIDFMPQGGPPLPQAQKDLFKNWILEGALDN
jgi:centrosomal CEP192-like protein